MRYLFLSLAVLIACNPTRERTDTSNYDVITEKCYVLREHPDRTDSLVNARRDSMVRFLEQHGFPKRYMKKDSMLFRRTNGQEVEVSLLPPADAWESNAIIVFDPIKNPWFINLRKGTGQVEDYVSGP